MAGKVEQELIRMAKKEIVSKDIEAKSKEKPVRKGAAKGTVAPAASEKKASAILTTTDISEHLATMFEIPKSHAKAYLAESIDMIGKHLKKGTKVRISGLGIFQVKKRAARKGRNPNTGDAIKIKASKRVAFAVSRDLKAKL